MNNSKKKVRANFRNSVFKRDNYTCQGCGKKYSIEIAEENLDAHHVQSRKIFQFGGYVEENGVSLCKNGKFSCHQKAEQWLNEGHGELGYSPEELYGKIGSSFELAIEKDKQNES